LQIRSLHSWDLTPAALACHRGLWLDLPCLGCAKSWLCGQYPEPAAAAGSLAPLTDRGEVIGHAVRTRDDGKVVFVSAGHRLDLASAVRVVLATCRGCRLPEPARQAHLFVNARKHRRPHGEFP
jgi:deoxyribonuclease V